MKSLKLSKEEQFILDKFEAGELENVPNMKGEINRHQEIAMEQFKKDATVSIRLNSDDLREMRIKASRSGLPYQTLISTLIHHYVTGKIDLSI